MKARVFILLTVVGVVLATALFVADQTVGVSARPILTASAEVLAPQLPGLAKPSTSEAPPPLEARAFLLAWLRPDGQIEVLASKNAELRWPIASVTKLFTASVVEDKLKLSDTVTFGTQDFSGIADHGYYTPNETFVVNDLLVSLLLDSSNDAANALARAGGGEVFVQAMNQLAKKLGLRDTAFYNPSGLDPDTPRGANYSTANDLLLMAKFLLERKPDLLAISRLPGAQVAMSNGLFHHQARSTNELLLNQSWSEQIVGGKTGQTDLAGKNLLLILQTPKLGGHLVSVVLGSPDHFQETQELINWVYRVYQL